jgi:hypothetical protein
VIIDDQEFHPARTFRLVVFNVPQFQGLKPAPRPAPVHGPNGGVADSLDEAKAAFRAAWDAPWRRKQKSVLVWRGRMHARKL